MTRTTLKLLLTLAVCLLLAACALYRAESRHPVIHPPEAELGLFPPTCTDCHEARSDKVVFERYNHTGVFARNHRQEAYQNESVCAMCHERSFCNDCHATKVELKPSAKDPLKTTRELPHRGDYLSRHQIDGRVDPTSCFRCHGNPRSAASCRPCHG